MALALYRKYRPRTFAEVIGQEHVTEPLAQALRTGRLHHAYLFSGPRGCGKTSSARILARSLNCDKGPTPDPCGECASCRALAPDGGGSIDVIEIDAASHGGVDDARELRERAFFAPVASRFKVYVIDEAHMVSSAGFNALLKLVEEPPEYVKFVFATTEPEKVLGTIRSRTHHYPFRLIPPGVLRPYLEMLCREEGVTVEPAVLPLVVRSGGGSARDTLSVLDQLISGAGPDGVSYARAVALLGVTDVALIDEMVDALAAADGATAYGVVDRVAEAGHDSRRFATDLLERLRDLIILRQVPDAAAKGIIDVPEDQLDRMVTQAGQLGPATLSRMADIVHNGLTEMRGTTAPRLLLELIVARMLLPGADESGDALLQRLERMEKRLGAATAGEPVPAPVVAEVRAPAPAAVPPPPSEVRAASAQPEATRQAQPPEPAPPPPPAPAAPVTVPSGQLDAAAIRGALWDEVLGIVGRKSKRVAALARDAVVRDVEGDTLVLVAKYTAHVAMLTDGAPLLAEALHEVVGGDWKVRCEPGGPEGAAPARSAPAPPRSVPAQAPASGPPARPAAPARTPPAEPAQAVEAWPETARPGGVEPEPSGVDAARAAARSAGAPGRTKKVEEPPRPEPTAYDGFDPGDEPLDDVIDEGTARQNSEEQALRLLAEQLGAEKIGEVDAR